MMLRRFLSRFLVRIALLGLVVGILFAGGWLQQSLGWAAGVYVLWRAFPGIKKDFRRAWRGIPVTSSGLARF